MRFIHSGGIVLLLMCGCSKALPPENYPITETYRVCEPTKDNTSDHWSLECNKVTRTTYPDGKQVTVRQLPMPKVQGQTVAEEEAPAPIHTWLLQEDLDRMAQDNLRKAMEEAVRRNPCKCQGGDPLCPCIP